MLSASCSALWAAEVGHDGAILTRASLSSKLRWTSIYQWVFFWRTGQEGTGFWMGFGSGIWAARECMSLRPVSGPKDEAWPWSAWSSGLDCCSGNLSHQHWTRFLNASLPQDTLTCTSTLAPYTLTHTLTGTFPFTYVLQIVLTHTAAHTCTFSCECTLVVDCAWLNMLAGFQSHPVSLFFSHRNSTSHTHALSQPAPPLPHVSVKTEMLSLLQTVCSLFVDAYQLQVGPTVVSCLPFGTHQPLPKSFCNMPFTVWKGNPPTHYNAPLLWGRRTEFYGPATFFANKSLLELSHSHFLRLWQLPPPKVGPSSCDRDHMACEPKYLLSDSL